MENSLSALAWFQRLYCAGLALAVAGQLPAHFRFLKQTNPLRPVPRLLGRVPLPRLGPATTLVTGLGLVLGLVVVAADRAPAGLLLGAGVAALVYHAQVIEFQTVRRKANSAIIILWVLGATALAGPESEVGIASASLLTIKIVIAQIYLSSGLLKLRHAGLRWADGHTLRAWMADYHCVNRSAVALRLASSLPLCRALSVVVLFFELSFWLVIPWPALAWLYVPLGIAFHVGTAVVMRIHYWIYMLPAYFIFLLPWIARATE